MIERIEKLELQLVLEPVAEAGVFHERQVGLGLTRVAENIAARVSVSARIVGGRPEGGKVEPMIRRRIRERSGGNPVRPVASAGR